MNGGPGPGEEGDDIESSHAPPPPGGRVSRSLDMEIARGVEGEMALASGPGPARGQVAFQVPLPVTESRPADLQPALCRVRVLRSHVRVTCTLCRC
eukprot:3480763-Rhodomonas_salina.1